MEMQTLQAEVRHAGGKGPARQLRMRGLIPAVFYGPGATPTSIAVNPKELRRVLTTERGRNAVVKLSMGGTEELAICRDVQIHPVDREPIHVDFYKVALDKPVTVHVPFVTVGKAIGTVEGGELHIVFRLLPVRALPEKIPVKIEVEISHLKIHDSIRVKELKLDPGVEVLLPLERTIVAVTTERKQVEEEVPAPGAVVPGAEGAAAAPGAPGAPGAAGAAPGAAGAAPGAGAAPAAAPEKKGKK